MTIAGFFSVTILMAWMIGIPATVAASNNNEIYLGVKISHFLKAASGYINVKFAKLGSNQEYMVYLNFNQEESSIGAGHLAFASQGTMVYWDLIYSSIQGGLTFRDLTNPVSLGTRYLADVVQTGDGSDCWKATTYDANDTFCLKPDTNYATIAGVISHTFVPYSSSETLSAKFDNLKSGYWSDVLQTYKFKYFTDEETNEMKCLSSNGWVEDFLMKRAPTGAAGDKFDDIGTGPTAFTIDDCDIDQFVWKPFGIG